MATSEKFTNKEITTLLLQLVAALGVPLLFWLIQTSTSMDSRMARIEAKFDTMNERLTSHLTTHGLVSYSDYKTNLCRTFYYSDK